MKLPSLTIFFPFYNDEGTVLDLITKAYRIGNELTDDLEVLAINGGKSKDNTFEKIKQAAIKFPNLKIIDRSDNAEGYAVIKYGFYSATKDWVFYTDGDAQYDISELKLLVDNYFKTKADVINGYKTTRGDGVVRHILGDIYAKLSSFIFELPIKDTDCDFRLIKNSYLKKITLISKDSSILGELIKKLEVAGAKFSEVPVSHFNRVYGKSNYTPFSLFREKFIGDLKLYFKLRNLNGVESKLRILKFGTVGFISIFIQIIIFNLFILFSSIKPFWATLISDQVSIVNSFWLNNRFTFKDKKHIGLINKIKPFFKFYGIVITSSIIQAGVVYVGNHIFGYNFLISNLFLIIGIVIAFIINYSFQKRIVWK